MLVIDKIPRADLSVDDMIERLLRMVVAGLRPLALSSRVGGSQALEGQTWARHPRYRLARCAQKEGP